jgi:hypothetical protein
MSTWKRWALPLLLLLLSAGDPTWAQCPQGKMGLQEAIERTLAGEALLEANAEVPRATASATQVEAPSDAGGSSAVNLPGFASILGLAQEQGLIDRKDGVTTISLTPFSFLALLQPQYSSNQVLYESMRGLRRLGGQVAFGGKGDSFDRDGDGMVDEALVAEDPNDIVTWEVKYQFGSRDRRDRVNYEPYFAALQSEVTVEANRALGQVAFAADKALTSTPDAQGCFPIADIRTALQQPDAVSALAQLTASDAAVGKAKEEIDKADSRPILTLVYGGTERKDEFGSDKRSAALRGSFTWLGGTNSAELSWSEVESLLEVDNAVTWKLGYNYSRSFLKGSALSKDGVTLAVAGSYEKLRDVPMATHDSVSKLNAKFRIPVTEGVEIPISVTWANHKDLLIDEEEVQGHIGFTVDYSKIREQLLGTRKKSES